MIKNDSFCASDLTIILVTLVIEIGADLINFQHKKII